MDPDLGIPTYGGTPANQGNTITGIDQNGYGSSIHVSSGEASANPSAESGRLVDQNKELVQLACQMNLRDKPAEGHKLEAFAPYTRLPSEIRQEIWRSAMLTPGMAFFRLTPHHFLNNPGPTYPSYTTIPAGKGIQTSKQWVEMGLIDRHAKSASQSLMHRPKFPRFWERHAKYPFNQEKTLVVFHFGMRPGAPMDWSWHGVHFHNPDRAYDRVGKSVKYVGLWWQPEERSFFGCQHERQGDGTSVYVLPHGEISRWILFFREAKEFYFLLDLDEDNLGADAPKNWRSGVSELIANAIKVRQEGKKLAKWEEYGHTWYELDAVGASILLHPKLLGPWATARFLRRHVDTLDAETRAKLDPEMSFKVLVTTKYFKRA